MSHNKHNNSSCSYAEQMISYLYGEADAREKSAFEAHLQTCSNCSDELAGFGFVRRSVLDWRAADFSNLETPAFDVPTVETEKSFSPVAVSSVTRSWFGNLKNLFSFNPTLATAALAILILCAGAALLAFNFKSRNDLAVNEKSESLTLTVVSPTIKVVPDPNEASEAAPNPKQSPLPVKNGAPIPQLIERGKAVAPVKAAVKISNEKSPRNSEEKSDRNLKSTDENNKKTTSTRKTRVPNLNDIDDEEDKSVRLMDLFEEIDTK